MDSSPHTAPELRDYLRQRRMGRTKVRIPEFEDFLKDVSLLFALRWGAEEYWSGSPRASDFGFLDHKYQAVSARLAVPLEWSEVKSILLPDEDKPRSTLITHIAAHCIEEVRVIASGLRRVLSRERVSTPIGKVQQLDTYCMRWLMRQPGRDFAEKGGMRQRVMAVVRREQFDTLENRVFKDFLIRAENLADGYLDEIEKGFSGTKVYNSVKHFRTACQAALSIPEMDLISGLTAFPQPNYVLQQDNRYSKIWTAYSKIVRLSNLAEKLWEQRQVLQKKLDVLKAEGRWQCEHLGETNYHSQVWVRPLDGTAEITEFLCSHHAMADERVRLRRKQIKQVAPVESGVGIVDLTGNHAWGPSLCIGGFHENATSRIYDDTYPILDDEPDAYKIVRLPVSKRTIRIPLEEIFPVINDPTVQDEKRDRLATAISYAAGYCSRLYGELRNIDRNIDELIVLSPDDWNAVTQEIVIRSFPMLERRRVHLLWRSIAAVIGLDHHLQRELQENDFVAVLDFRNDRSLLVSALKYLRDGESGRLVPQRGVYLRNGQVNEERYLLIDRYHAENVMSSKILQNAKSLCVIGDIPQSFKNFLMHDCVPSPLRRDDKIESYKISYGRKEWTVYMDGALGWSQKDGSIIFSREHEKRTLYFDELEPMWVVGQFNEKVVRSDIVKADERFKGGATKQYQLRRGLLSIGGGQHGVEFLFHIGELLDSTRLHSYREEFSDIIVKRDIPLDATIIVSPGQGIAITNVLAPQIFKEPIVLDYLQNMTLSTWTIQRMEEEMRRSFPPTCATVEAYSRYDYEGYNLGFSFAPTTFLGRVKESVERYLRGSATLSDIPDKAFAQAKRRTVRDLRPGESRLHLLDRRNVFGNTGTAIRPYWLTEESEGVLLRRLLKALPHNKDKCLRLLAWTYRGANPDLVKCLRSIVRNYTDRKYTTASLPAVEVSFLSNFLPEPGREDLEKKALDVLFTRLFQGLANGNDLRLFYNLMQFDIKIFSKIFIPPDKCCNIVNCLLRDMKGYRLFENPTNYKSCLRSFLYFLRIREMDRSFLRPEEWFEQHKAELDLDMMKRMSSIHRQASIELSNIYRNETDDMRMLRLAARKYLNGQGTIEDIVNVQEDD